MSRLRDLPPSRLDDLPAACRRCMFWETGGGRRGPVSDAEAPQVTAAKQAWWQATQLEWGTPGKAVYDDDTLVGYALFAPPGHVPRTRRLPGPVSDDALLLAVLWVAEGWRGTGVAKTLLQAVLREAHRRRARAVEAYGARGLAAGAGATCVIPEAFLLAHGFTVTAEDASFPLLRLDLRQTVRWQESVGHALESVLSVLGRRERVPARPALEAGSLDGRGVRRLRPRC
ncbi:MAG TPA: GNAT family N-acetyltransferase [Egibacteraceae bacterium]